MWLRTYPLWRTYGISYPVPGSWYYVCMNIHFLIPGTGCFVVIVALRHKIKQGSRYIPGTMYESTAASYISYFEVCIFKKYPVKEVSHTILWSYIYGVYWYMHFHIDIHIFIPGTRCLCWEQLVAQKKQENPPQESWHIYVSTSYQTNPSKKVRVCCAFYKKLDCVHGIFWYQGTRYHVHITRYEQLVPGMYSIYNDTPPCPLTHSLL